MGRKSNEEKQRIIKDNCSSLLDACGMISFFLADITQLHKLFDSKPKNTQEKDQYFFLKSKIYDWLIFALGYVNDNKGEKEIVQLLLLNSQIVNINDNTKEFSFNSQALSKLCGRLEKIKNNIYDYVSLQ